MTPLEQLQELVAVPENPYPLESFDGKLGTLTLPEDYYEFIRTYGEGWLYDDYTGELGIMIVSDVAFEDDLGRDRGEGFRGNLDVAEQWHEMNPDIFPKPYPAVPGFLVWGETGMGDMLGWHADQGDSSKWPVAVASEFEYLLFEESFTEYLLKCCLPGNTTRPFGQFSEHIDIVKYYPRLPG